MYRNLLTLLTLTALFAFTNCKGDDAVTEDTEDTDTGVEIIEVDANIEGVLGSVTVRQNDSVRTVLIVAWTQESASDEVWLEFTFENGDWFQSPATARSTGEHEEVVLGVPENSDVTMKIVAVTEGDQQETEQFEVPNGAAPASMPRPVIDSYDASIASPHKWLFGTVDDSISPLNMYDGPFWLYIIDREGRIVWYYANLGDNPVIGFPRVSRDGRYIYFGNRTPWNNNSGFVNTLVKMTLDYKYFDEFDMPLWDNVDQTDEGTFLYNNRSCFLMERMNDGTDRTIWHTDEITGMDCYSNTVNWNPIDDTILMSFPYWNIVTEVERESGDLIATYGDHSSSFSFEPSNWGFNFQHFPHITPFGTFMVSSHQPGSETQHYFAEFEIDRDAETLTEIWSFEGGSEFAEAMGEAHYVENGGGNVLGNYGTGGVIKEITQGGEVAWQVNTNNMMVGHCTLVEDLYALNRGPE